jgi:hypothetical protein
MIYDVALSKNQNRPGQSKIGSRNEEQEVGTTAGVRGGLVNQAEYLAAENLRMANS